MKKFLTEQQRKQNLAELETRIAESFVDNFNKIKRIDEKTVFQGLGELDANTYAKQMNSTGDWPWAKHLDKSTDADTDPKHRGNKQQRVNDLSREGFDKAFYKKYPVGQVKINTNKGEYAFDAMSHGANHTFYQIIFKSTSEHAYLHVQNDKGSPKGYYIRDKSIELDEQSSKIVLDMLKYNNTSRD